MKMKDIKDLGDLKDVNANDVVELLDELRAVATKRGTELLSQGRAGARRAMGVPDERTVGRAFFVGILLGAVVGAFVAMLMTPLEGREARRRLGRQVERARERVPETRPDGNGRSVYEQTGYEGAAERPAPVGRAGTLS